MLPVNPPRDPLWQEWSASLRLDEENREVLYLKLPTTECMDLRRALEVYLHYLGGNNQTDRVKDLHDFLRNFLAKVHRGSSVIFSITVEAARLDVEQMEGLLARHHQPLLSHYCSVVRKGLSNDQGVDWIARMGGPGYRLPEPQPQTK